MDSLEAGWYRWLAEKVDSIETTGNISKMWVNHGQENPYRDEIINEICVGAFGTEEPADEDITDNDKRVALHMLRMITAGRAMLHFRMWHATLPRLMLRKCCLQKSLVAFAQRPWDLRRAGRGRLRGRLLC